MLSEETHCTVSRWQCSLLIYLQFASSQVRILYLACDRQLPSYTDAKRPEITTPEPSEHPVKVILQGSSWNIWEPLASLPPKDFWRVLSAF